MPKTFIKILTSTEKQKVLLTLKDKAKTERTLTLEILHLLRQVDEAHLHLELGFSSLFAFCTGELGYSGGAAHRRIEAMRLLRDIPSSASAEIESKIERGELNISLVSQVGAFIKREEAESRVRLSDQRKIELVQKVQSLSTRDAERTLIAESKIPGAHSKPDSLRVISESKTEVKFTADRECMELLEKLKSVMGGRNANLDLNETLKVLAKSYLEKKIGATQEAQVSLNKNLVTQTATPAPEFKIKDPNSRTIPTPLRRHLLRKAQFRCEYNLNKKTGALNRCSETRNLEIDHILPFMHGGMTETANLRVLCRGHNLYLAKKAGLGIQV